MKDQGIPSGEYASLILEFSLEYGGGRDAPEIRFMHHVASQFGCSKVLGETFLECLDQDIFPRQNEHAPLAANSFGIVQPLCRESGRWDREALVEE